MSNFTEAEIDLILSENVLFEEFIKRFVDELAYVHEIDGRTMRTANGEFLLEEAFKLLKLSDPHPAPEHECSVADCHKFGSGVSGQADGYRRYCPEHWVDK